MRMENIHMAIPSPGQLYISTLAANIQGLHERGLALVTALQRRGFSIYMPFTTREAAVTEREIDRSAGLIALVDRYWSSSTWKASEVTYALDGCGMAHVVPDHPPIPTFIYWLGEPFDLTCIAHHARVIYLPREVQEAAEVVVAAIAEGRGGGR